VFWKSKGSSMYSRKRAELIGRSDLNLETNIRKCSIKNLLYQSLRHLKWLHLSMKMKFFES
jgi:hypothetical protein